jgi:hypothetical protein
MDCRQLDVLAEPATFRFRREWGFSKTGGDLVLRWTTVKKFREGGLNSYHHRTWTDLLSVSSSGKLCAVTH